MSRYIFITRDFHILPAAYKLQQDGNEVVVGMVAKEYDSSVPKEKTETRLSLYNGILDKKTDAEVLSMMKRLPDKDEWFFMCDFGDLWEFSEKALEMGFTKGIFPTKDGYKFEQDREFGKNFAKKNFPELKVAEVNEFSSIEDAIKLIGENKDKIYVLKSEGSLAETVVPETDDPELAAKQIIGAMRTEQKEYEKGGFTLEEKIQDPVELTPVMVFWNGEPLCSVIELENKPVGAGNIGRLSGGCQNLTIQTDLECEMNKIAFPPIIYDMAKKTTGIAVYDAGLLYDGKNDSFFFTEFCAQRWGFDGFYSEMAMSADKDHKHAVENHFDSITAGKNPLQYKFGCAVRMFQTEPSAKKPGNFKDGYEISFKDDVAESLYLYCVKKEKGKAEEEDRLVSVGYDKDIGTCTGAGNSPEEAIKMAYKTAESVAMTGLLYRPKFDFMSKAYFTSIMNRYNWLKESGLI